jgi:hypothetical protein
MDIKILKKSYTVFASKYKLPSFHELDSDFEISKFDKESDVLLRAIRKLMIEKVVNSINFLEMLINPGNAPRMYFAYIKGMSVADRKLIDEIYGVLSNLTLDSLSLEIESSEKEEAELVKKIFLNWGKMKPKFKQIVNGIRNPKSPSSKRERSYFG